MQPITRHSLQGSQYYYNIEREIGRSRTYVLYLASFGQRRFAVVKTLNESCLKSPEVINQFLHEISILQTLNHPQIVSFYEFIEVQNIPYLVTEYLEGVTLEEWVKNAEINEALAIRYVQQIGDALIYLHQQGIIHQDVSPQNIIISSNGEKATLIDFSNACEINTNFQQDSVNNSLTTIDTGVPVTPGYAPLEQHLSVGKIDEYTDVYGLAATFYYLVTKTHPLSALKRKGIIGKAESLIHPRQLNTKLSRRSQKAILKGLEIEPQKRVKTVKKWLEILVHSPAKSHKSYGWLLLGLLLIGVATASGFYFWFYLRNQPPNSLQFKLKGNQDNINHQYTVNQDEPIQVIEGKVCDPNRHTDISKIQLTLTQETPIKTFTIKDFKINGDDKQCLTFDYQIDESIGANIYSLTAIAYDESQGISDPYQVNLMVNAPPEQLKLEKVIENGSDFETDNPITFQGTVLDQNGGNDLAKIDFWLINNRTKEKENLSSLSHSELLLTNPNSNQVTFRYNIDRLAAGNYTIEAQAKDRAGTQSKVQSLSFKVNSAPQNFELSIDRSSPDQILITGSVNDYNPEDIQKVVMTLYRDGERQKNITLTQLTPKDSQNQTYRFEYTLNEVLPAGNYQLEGKAQDKSGKFSNIFTTVFVIEEPQESQIDSEELIESIRLW